MDTTPQVDLNFDAFTERGYRELVRLAKARYRFASFVEAAADAPCVLWRHDIDCSMHRALALARIEAEEGVRATYFVHLHSVFYNALEPDVASAFAEIVKLGHEPGLHFDPHFYADRLTREGELDRMLRFERDLVGNVWGVEPRVCSLHNPDGWLHLDAETLAGMVNTYGRGLRGRFRYFSDSNGFWRTDVREALASGRERQLQVLTHPEWWVPEPMSPRARVARCIEGRAARTAESYDRTLDRMGRPNIR